MEIKKSIVISGPPRSGNSLMSLGIAFLEFNKEEVLVLDGRDKNLTDESFWLQGYTDCVRCVIIDDLPNEDAIKNFFNFVGQPFSINIMNKGRIEIEVCFILVCSFQISNDLLTSESFKRRFDVINNYSK